jgi:hypothetical protein
MIMVSPNQSVGWAPDSASSASKYSSLHTNMLKHKVFVFDGLHGHKTNKSHIYNQPYTTPHS